MATPYQICNMVRQVLPQCPTAFKGPQDGVVHEMAKQDILETGQIAQRGT